MSEEIIKKENAGWTVILPISALTLLGALMLSVSNDAAISLDLAKQHGESILLLREELKLLKEDMRLRTDDRYTSKDADRDHMYISRDIMELKNSLDSHLENKNGQ